MSVVAARIITAWEIVQRVVARRRLPRRVAPEDVVQDVIVALIPACVAYDETRHVPFEAYVVQRTHWLIRDCVRRYFPVGGGRRRLGAVTVPFEDDHRTERDESGFERIWFAELGATLTPLQRAWLAGRLQGETLREIGQRHGVSESRVCQVAAQVRPMLARAA